MYCYCKQARHVCMCLHIIACVCASACVAGNILPHNSLLLTYEKSICTKKKRSGKEKQEDGVQVNSDEFCCCCCCCWWAGVAGYLVLQDGFSKRERERDDVLSSEFVSAAQCDGALHARVNFLWVGAHMQRLGQMVGEQVYGVTSESSQRLQRESTCSLHECVGEGGVC